MLKVGILGCGNLGNQVASLAKRTKNFPAVAINASERDIDSVKGYIECIIFGDKAGSGKDRTIAKEFLKNNVKQLIADEALKNLVEDNDYIFVVTSAGGGTGSGTGPVLTHVLTDFYANSEKPKTFINVGVLPAIGESVGAQRNAAGYINELRQRDKGVYMLFDNNRVKAPTNEIFEKVNAAIVDSICVIRGDYSNDSPYGMIDEKDMHKIVTQPGLIFVDRIQNIFVEDIAANGSVEELMLRHINTENCMVPIDRNKIVRRMGVISYLSEDLHGYFDDNLPKIRSFYGEPMEDFRHYAVNETGSAEENGVALILSGLTIPMNRVEKIKQRIDAVDKEFDRQASNEKLEDLVEHNAKYDVTNQQARQKKEFDLDSIFDKY